MRVIGLPPVGTGVNDDVRSFQLTVVVQIPIVAYTIVGGAVRGGSLLVSRSSSWISRATHTQWVLRKRESDTAFSIASTGSWQCSAVQLGQRNSSVSNILKLNKTHGAVVMTRRSGTSAGRLVLCSEG